MKYYLATTTTMYDGFEFTDKSLIKAENEEEARGYLSQEGIISHDLSVEPIEKIDLKEVSEVDYKFLRKFL